MDGCHHHDCKSSDNQKKKPSNPPFLSARAKETADAQTIENKEINNNEKKKEKLKFIVIELIFLSSSSTF